MGSPPSDATGLKIYEGCSSFDWIFWMGEFGRRGNAADPIANVSVSAGWAGGLAGRTESVRVPVAKGKGDDVGVGKCSAVH